MPYTATGDRPDAAGIPVVTCGPAVTGVPAVTGFPAIAIVLTLAVFPVVASLMLLMACIFLKMAFFANTGVPAIAGVQIRFLSSPFDILYSKRPIAKTLSFR
jgi:hypothetical protein